ncbi:MAG TPA: hypothetical protein VJU77_09020 [Chthoniobacterales bacterium]|nr:hypothetical protein [Chthoniobacterales bacterium]
MSQSEVPEAVVSLTQVLIESPGLRTWFCSLERLSDSARSAAFTHMAGQMRAAGEDADLTAAIALLAHPGMYDTVLAAVRERAKEITSNP